MPERIFTFRNTDAPVAFPSWGSIWAGTLTFVAIWSILGFLGAAVFASLATPSGSFAGLGIGMGFWAVVLTIIAMFGAGFATGSVSGKRDAALGGTVMFALSVLAALIVTYLARISMGVPAEAGATATGWTAGLGWVAFVALVLGWAAAVGGTWIGMSRSKTTEVSGEVKRAA